MPIGSIRKAGWPLMVCGVLALTGCATANPFPVTGGEQENAVVDAHAGLSFLVNNGNSVYIRSVNGVAVGENFSSVMLPPEKYTLDVVCESPSVGQYGEGKLTISVQAGRHYELDFDSAPDGKHCQPFVYDSTGGRGAYSETAHVPLSKEETANWDRLRSNPHAGHAVVDWIPRSQSDDDWLQMLEVESWTKLMFPGTADAFFQQQAANARKACADIQVTVNSESADDVTYEFETPASCSGTQVRSQFGRFLTGQFGIYHAAFISRTPVQDPDRAKWINTLHAVTIINAN